MGGTTARLVTKQADDAMPATASAGTGIAVAAADDLDAAIRSGV